MAGIDALTPEQSESAGRAARALLHYGLTEDAGAQLVKVALETVCWTAPVARTESVALLRRCLTADVIAQHGYEYVPSMTEYLPQLAATDEQFALELVKAVGTLRESRDDWVPMGGRVMPMRVNKHDMLSTSNHHLEKQFEQLMRERPAFGTRVFIATIDTHIRTEESRFGEPNKTHKFLFRSSEVTLLPDGSYLWATEGGHRQHETWFKVSGTFRQVLVECARSSPAALNAILDAYRDQAQWAMLWNQLLLAGIEAPDSLGPELVELLCVAPILDALETRRAAGRLLTAAYPHFDPPDRAQIEAAVLKLPNVSNDDTPTDQAEHRDRLLGCIPMELIESDAARSLREEIDARGGAPENRPPVEISSARFISEDEWLTMQGVQLQEQQNTEFSESLGEVKRFCHEPNPVPSIQAVREFRPRLEEFERLVSVANASGVDEHLSRNSEHYVYGCCEVMSRAKGLHADDELYQYIRKQLLTAASHPSPEQHESDDEQWDNSTAGWGSPLPRIDAAQGLMNLARHAETLDGEILEAINELAHDPVNAVRHQIACHLGVLWRTANDVFWRLAEFFSREELRIAVLHFFLDGVLLRLPRKDTEHAEELIRCIYDRMVENPRAESVRESCTVFFLRRALWDHNDDGRAFIDAAVKNPVDKSIELGTATSLCRELMSSDDDKLSGDENTRVRRWAFHLLRRAFESTNQQLTALLKISDEELTEDQKSQMQTLAGLEDRFVHEVYFASEAFEAKKQGESSIDLHDERRKRLERFASEADEVLEAFCQTGLTNVAYTVLQTLQHLRHANPRRIFLLVGQLLRSSTGDYVQHESIVADRVVELVEQYLAEERGQFRKDSEMLETLMDLLDLFVDAGWPKAMLLTYRLDEAIRG